LLLNLVASDTDTFRALEHDRPAWRRRQCGPGAAGDLDPQSRPSGPRDLYTWQSRRLRLHHDGTAVHGVVLSYADPLTPQNRQGNEPMTGWRRSGDQEKKDGQPLIYMPHRHDPARAAWRGLASLLGGGPGPSSGQRGEPAEGLRPRILDWIA